MSVELSSTTRIWNFSGRENTVFIISWILSPSLYVGITTIATSIGEDAGTIEEVYEPFLIKEGYLKRTPRGREATEIAYKHLNKLKDYGDQSKLF